MATRRDPQWLRGVLPLCLLAILVEGECYGYDLARRLEAAELGPVKGGTLYPVLARLERDGLVDVRWASGDAGPSRKYYALTDAGRQQLSEDAHDWLEFTDRAAALLRPATDRRIA
jgi:PadR family transcriptional regulator PadR